jgi:hypothetical protein
MTLAERVLAALGRAEENGYGDELAAMTDGAIAFDLCTCDADLEMEDPLDFLPAIKAWRAERSRNTPASGSSPEST